MVRNPSTTDFENTIEKWILDPQKHQFKTAKSISGSSHQSPREACKIESFWFSAKRYKRLKKHKYCTNNVLLVKIEGPVTGIPSVNQPTNGKRTSMYCTFIFFGGCYGAKKWFRLWSWMIPQREHPVPRPKPWQKSCRLDPRRNTSAGISHRVRARKPRNSMVWTPNEWAFDSWQICKTYGS